MKTQKQNLRDRRDLSWLTDKCGNGSVTERTITIVEENVAPMIHLSVVQGGTAGRIVARRWISYSNRKLQ